MGFKLVRVDAIEPSKVFLSIGSHLIGRGKFLDCNDHRVSRKHAELIVTSDSVLLKSLHQNPCFYKKKLSENTIVFSQPDSQILANGDQFGLVPDSFWYEVIYCPDNSVTDGCENTSNEQNVCVENDKQEIRMNEDTDSYEQDQEKLNYSSDSVLHERSASPSLLAANNLSSPAKNTEDGSEMAPQNDSKHMDITLSDHPAESIDQPNESTVHLAESINHNAESTVHLAESTGHLAESINQNAESTGHLAESINQNDESTIHLAESINQNAELTVHLAETINQNAESTYNPTESTDNHAESNQAACKRAHSEDSNPNDVKKVKVEPEESSKESVNGISPQTVKLEPASPQDVKPGPSNDHGSSSKNSNNNGPPMPQSPTKPPNKPLRERCMYGANCYRRNPQHKATFSHPSDPDWGSGQRGECPWGARCRRADPRHWRDHDHPPGALPPQQGNRRGMQFFRRNGNNFFINANTVNFYDDHFEVEDSDGESVDYDYEF